ncbi:hypothetical protein B566_EDAN002818 [Ephemera danica]|nr:hypothetical protein B566_EDAN002818 [Ephemera danica]
MGQHFYRILSVRLALLFQLRAARSRAGLVCVVSVSSEHPQQCNERHRWRTLGTPIVLTLERKRPLRPKAPCTSALAEMLHKGHLHQVTPTAGDGGYADTQVMHHRWPSDRACTLLLLCALVSVAAATTGSWPPKPQVDLLEGLTLQNLSASVPGVSLASGPHSLRPAIYLQGDFRELRLPQPVFSRVVALLRRSPEFTLAVALRQDEANVGTILYLELQSSGRKDEIRLHYTHSGNVLVETFPFRLADGAWHRLALWVSGAQVELLVDCQRLYRRVIRAPDRNFSADTSQSPHEPSSASTVEGGELALWLGQRNNKHSLFKVRVVAGPHGYLSQCPHLDSSCPTCGQYLLLENTVQQLTKHLHRVTQELAATVARVSKLEECDCQKSCRVNGSVHADGATWQRDCELCACVRGEVQCRPVQCPPITCKHPEMAPGECCPSCLKQCFLKGVFYDHGVSVNLKQCVECVCQDGLLRCERIDPVTMCPPLPCPPDQQFNVPDGCCKFCPGVDYCAKGHNCHANATCLNLQTTYSCRCIVGFQGDGHTCTDVDECREEGGPTGHHCRSNTRCRNTPGSYTCECLPGFLRVDRFNCAEHDECRSGEHECDPHAQCLNTQGSYHCHCMPGYHGDGFTCKHIDECSEGSKTCHPSARCINTEGGFECSCEGQGPDCSLNCMYGGVEVLDNGHVQGPACQQCLCRTGRVTCQKPQCDCDAVDVRLECCPQCDTNSQCHHQELHHVAFHSGERWIYQCQTCECLHGEVDCWPVECPPVSCLNPIKSSGDCCPRCEDDPCALESSGNSSELQGQPCSYAGLTLPSGSEWRAAASSSAYDKCTSCRCKDGQLCCSYANQCVGDPPQLPDTSQQQQTASLSSRQRGRMFLIRGRAPGGSDPEPAAAATPATDPSSRSVHAPQTLASAAEDKKAATTTERVDSSSRGH